VPLQCGAVKFVVSAVEREAAATHKLDFSRIAWVMPSDDVLKDAMNKLLTGRARQKMGAGT
jgi:hypothetical protein